MNALKISRRFLSKHATFLRPLSGNKYLHSFLYKVVRIWKKWTKKTPFQPSLRNLWKEQTILLLFGMIKVKWNIHQSGSEITADAQRCNLLRSGLLLKPILLQNTIKQKMHLICFKYIYGQKNGRNQIKMHLCVKCYSPSALARLSLMRNLDVNISIASSKVVQDKVTSKNFKLPM